MRILSRRTGRILLFMNLDELIPIGSVYMPDALPLLIERYSFSLPPNLSTPWNQVLEQGLKFELGKFKGHDNEENLIEDLTVYNNGIVVTAESTDISQAFIDDLFEWGPEAIGLRVAKSAFALKAFLSEIVVEFNSSVDRALTRLTTLLDSFRSSLKRNYDAEFPAISVAALRLDYERAVTPLAFQNLAVFNVERRLNHRFTENVYLCQAPLPTGDHIKILEQLEVLLTADATDAVRIAKPRRLNRSRPEKRHLR